MKQLAEIKDALVCGLCVFRVCVCVCVFVWVSFHCIHMWFVCVFALHVWSTVSTFILSEILLKIFLQSRSKVSPLAQY